MVLGFPDSLLDQVEMYAPQLMTVLRETARSSEEVQTEILKGVVARDELSTDTDSAQVIAESDKPN